MACRNLKDRLPVVLTPLQEVSLENSGERNVEANALLAQIDLKFMGVLDTFVKCLVMSKASRKCSNLAVLNWQGLWM